MNGSALPLRLALLACLVAGCEAPMQRASPSALARGELGAVRSELHRHRATQRGDRGYLLDRLRVASLTLADGYPRSADALLREVYDVLRTRGINDDRTVQSIVLYEGVKLWKGEPFEQALALTYVALTQASLGSWDNARAAVGNALFYLRDFTDEGETDLDPDEIARRALLYERALAEGKSPQRAKREAEAEADFFETRYVPRESNYRLGYLLGAVASAELGRSDEASGRFQRVLELDPELEPLVASLRGGGHNTILVVGYGLGPRKTAYGPDGVFTRFVPRTASSDAPLTVRVGDGEPQRFPVVTDVNRMAGDHRWNDTEEIRRAKSLLGRLMTAGGLAAAAYGIEHEDLRLAGIGTGVAALGLAARAGARADTRHADTLPQRYYLLPLRLDDPPRPIELSIEGDPAARLTLLDLRAPAEGAPTTLRYVRLPGGGPGPAKPPEWAGAQRIRYTNPYRAASDADDARPYVFGGRDVRPPTDAVLADAFDRGHLDELTSAEVRNLYRAEGLTWSIELHAGFAPRHVLERGPSLISPVPGSVGYTRLFGRLHPPYQPRSPALRQHLE